MELRFRYCQSFASMLLLFVFGQRLWAGQPAKATKHTSALPTQCSTVVQGTSDIGQLVGRLAAARIRPKGEFETHAEYETRREAQRLKIAPQAVALVIDGNQLVFKYDADKGTMRAEVPTEADVFLADLDGPKIKFRRVGIARREFVGTNGFGVKKLITYLEDKEFGIEVAPGSRFDFRKDTTLFEFPMELQDAKALKPFLRLSLSGTLADAELHTGISTTTATLDVPYQHKSNQFYFSLIVDRVRILDCRDGAQLTEFLYGEP